MSSQVSKVLLGIGGGVGAINGVVDIITAKPLAAHIFGFDIFLGVYKYLFGILGIVGGLLVLYFGLLNPQRRNAIIASIVAIAGICPIAVLALIGAIMMEEK